MEIAQAALFLCSDMSSAMVGQSINVDGGAVFF
jgi:enoyl-[acyl-carrier-protein] reductase (NADH)